MKFFSLNGGRSILLSAIVFSTAASAAIDTDASIIYLRTSCTESGSEINNCFTDLNTLNAWVWNARTPAPKASSPLKIDIGPGTFNGRFSCVSEPWNGKKYGSVTMQGSGVENTTLQNGSGPISTSRCKNMVFSHMTLKNTGNLFGVSNIGGSTVWNNISIDGIGYAWFDSPTGCNVKGTHFWFNSTIKSRTAANSAKAYYTACGESWFFGSEIIASGSAGGSNPIFATGGEVHVYGSVIRALPEGNTSATAITSINGSEVHIHGTGIDVIGTGSNNITALSAGAGSSIHANASSYVMKTGVGGKVTRVKSANGGVVDAEYQWQKSATPPSINTETGADTVVITNTADNHPHMLVSDNTCASKWFDFNTNSCM